MGIGGIGHHRWTYPALASAAMASIWAVPSSAQNATAQGQASAIVLRPMSLIAVEQLDFGGIIPAAVTGNVVVGTDGSLATTGGVIVTPGSTQPARFVGQGSTNRVVIRTGSNQIFLIGPGTQMRVDNFTIGALSGLTQNGSSGNYRITSANGVIGFSVGGTLRVNAGQADGLYSGSFTITFNYQ